MSKPGIEQVTAAQKASTEMLVALMRTSFEGMQRLAELNMAATRELFSSTVAAANTLASSKDINEVAQINQQMAKSDYVMEYWRKVYDLVGQMQKDVTALMQNRHSQLNTSAASAIDENTAAAPVGGEIFANAMKTMLEQTNKAFENMTALAGQMTNIASANMPAKGDGPANKAKAKK
jgi:phasin family protein